MINIIILDDDKMICDSVKSFLSKNLKFEYTPYIFDRYDNQLKEYIIKNTTPTIYILDIIIHQRDDGIRIAREIKRLKKLFYKVIFMTDYAEKAMMAIRYQTDALDFIWKKDVEFLNMLVDAVNNAKKEIMSITNEKDEKYVLFYVDYKPIRLCLDDIICCDKSGDKKVKIYALDNSKVKTYSVAKSVRALADELGEEFFYLSRTSIVNPKYVGTVLPEKEIVKMKYNIELVAPENNIRELMKCLK